MPTQNLVQIQRDLQSLPPGPQTMMYLKRAKDGMVASVPPYLAAAELSSREKMAQREALASGAAPGEQPTVSQQLSQKADLLALQAMKKREMDAASMNQARTAQMPAPEGSPEPEEQPQPEGGIASLPVEFGFEGGGLVAFTDGGSIYSKPDPLVQAMNRSQPSAQDISSLDPYVDENGNPRPKSQRDAILAAKAGLRGTQQNAADYQRLLAQKQTAAQSAAYPKEAIRRMEEFYPADAWAGRLAQPSTPASPVSDFSPGRTSSMTPQQREAQIQQPPAPPQQRPPAAPKPQAAAPQPPAAPSPQQVLETDIMRQLGMAPGAQGVSAAAAMGAPAQDMAGTAADVKAAQAAFGLDKAAGEEERRLIEDMRARHAQQQRERARMGLKGVLAGFSQGYGGAAAADVAASQRAYAEDMAQQQEMYKLINAINTGNRKEAEKAFEKTIGLKQEREKETGATSRAELQAKVNMYDSMRRSGDSRYSTDKHFEAAMAQAREAAARGDRADKAQSDANLRSLVNSLVPEANRLLSEYNKAVRPADRADYKRQYDAVAKQLEEARAQLAKLGGIEPSSRAAAPAPAPANRPPLASFQR